MKLHLRSLAEARPVLRELHRSGRTVGSVHSLGALHLGHAHVIETSARENDATVVTIYPNKIQLAPGARYRYDLDRDVEFAFAHGATHVISSHDEEMFPPEYATYLDQGEAHRNLDATVVPHLFRGMITGCLRWISFVRPTRTYWGLKDIGQALLVERAVADLLVDTEVRMVPCVRHRSGVPVSSRLAGLDDESMAELAHVYRGLEVARRRIADGVRDSRAVLAAVAAHFEAPPLRRFRVLYVKIADTRTLRDVETIAGPVIVHCVVTNGQINHFDGLLLRTEEEIHAGPTFHWVD